MGARIFGLAASTAWAALVAAYTVLSVGLDNLFMLLPHELGMFLAGVTVPLALLWLAIGQFQRDDQPKREPIGLEGGTEQAHHLAERLADQARVAAAHELHIRRDIALRISKMIAEDINDTAMALVGMILPPEQKNSILNSYQRGERNVFFNAILYFFADERRNQTLDTLRMIPGWPGPLAVYCDKFQRIQGEIRDADPQGTLKNHFETAPMGQVYTVFHWLLRNEAAPSGTATTSADAMPDEPPSA